MPAATLLGHSLRLICHATLQLAAGGRRLLVDPMLDPAGACPPIPHTENDRRNPLVELPEPPEVVVGGIDAVLITHLHPDHFDDTAAALLPRELPLFCQPEDAERLRELGFADLRPVEDVLTWAGVEIRRTAARHGRTEADADMLAPVSGFLLPEPDGRVLYLASDTVLYEPVERVLDEVAPDVIVLNASGARFAGGEPIVMDIDEVVAVARRAPAARIVVVHLEAINHCVQTRADLHQRLCDEALTERVTVPEDGAAVPIG